MNYTFTGQFSYMDDPSTSGVTEGFGLMFYRARWADPVLGRFAQADSIIPGGVQGLDRYAYTRNNPVRYTDPSGHDVCDEDGNCYNSQGWYRARGFARLSTVDTWKMMIRGKYGVTMKDGKMKWSSANLQTSFRALSTANDKLHGNLRRLVGGTTFTLAGGGDKYYGAAHHDGSGITFHVFNSEVAIPITNFLHETGHLIDIRTNSAFSGSLPTNPSWVKDDYVDSGLLLGKLPEPVQAKPLGEKNLNEQWADAFANYVADNINLNRTEGMAMATDVANAIDHYFESYP